MKKWCLVIGAALLVIILTGAQLNAQTVAPLNVSATSVGLVSLSKPPSGPIDTFLVVLVSVTDQHGMPVADLKANNFNVKGVFVGERANASDSAAVLFAQLTVEAVIAAQDGDYLLQLSSAGSNLPVNLSAAAGHPAKSIIRVTQSVRDLGTKGEVRFKVVASGQTAY